MENKNVTIVDLFIDILSKNKDTQSQNMVKCLKVFIRIPECAEFLNVIIIFLLSSKILKTLVKGLIKKRR